MEKGNMTKAYQKLNNQQLSESIFNLRERMKLYILNDENECRYNDGGDQLKKTIPKDVSDGIKKLCAKMYGLDWPKERKACVEFLSHKLSNSTGRREIMQVITAWSDCALDILEPHIPKDSKTEEYFIEDIDYDSLPLLDKVCYLLYRDIEIVENTLEKC
jgi:hypothetical protein